VGAARIANLPGGRAGGPLLRVEVARL